MIRVNLAERQRHLSKRQHHPEPVYGHPMASTSSRTESEEVPQVVKEIPYKVVKMDDPRLVMKKKVLLRELESRQSSHVITEDNMRQHDRTETPTSHKERLQAYFKTLTRDEPPQPRSLGPKLSLTGGAINLLFTERDEKNTPDLIKIYPVSTNERPYYFSGIHHTFTPTNKTVKFEVDGREFSSVEGYVKSMMALELRGDVIQVEDMAFRRYFQDKGISQRQLDTWLTDRGFLYYQKALVHRLKSDPEMLKKLVETEKKVIIYTFRLDELLGSGVEYKCIDKYWEDLAALRVCIRYPTRFPVKSEDFWIVPRLIKGYNLLGCFLMAIRHQLQTGEKIEDLDFEMLEYSTNYTENIVHKRFYEEEIPTKRSRMSMRTSEYSFKTSAETPQRNEFRPQTPNTIFGELHLQSVSGSVQGSPTRSECNSVSTSMSDYNIEPTFKAPLPRFSTNSPNLTTPNKLSNSFTQYRNNSFFGSSTSLSTLCSIRLNTSAHSSREESIQNGSNGANFETTPTFGANENRKVHDQQHFETQESSKISTFDLSKMCSPNMERSRVSEGTIKSFHFQPFVAKIPRKNVENEENAMDSEDTLTPPTRSENSSRNPSGNSVNQKNVCGVGEKIDQNGCHGPHGEGKIGNIGQNRGSDVVVKAGKDQIRHENCIQRLDQTPGTSEIQQVQSGQQRLHGEDRNGRSGNIRPSEWGNQVRNEIFERTGHLQQVGNVQVQPVDHLPQVQQGQRKVPRNGCNDGQGQIKLPENTYQGERDRLRQEIHGHQAQQVQNRQNLVQNVENRQSQSEILLHQDARTRSGPQRHLEQLDGQNHRKIHIIHDGEDSESDDELSETMETCSNPSIEVEMDYSRRMEERNQRRRDVSPARSNKHFTPRKLPGQRVEMEENVVPSSSTVPTRNVDVSAKRDVNSTTKRLWNQENPPKLSAEPILIDEKNLEAPEIPQKSDADTKKASNPQEKAIRTGELDSLYPKNVQIEPLAQSIDDSDFANAFSSSDMDVRPKNEAEPTPETSQAAPCVREIDPSSSDDGIFQFVRTALQGQEIQIEMRNPQGMNELEAGKGEATDLADDNESVMSEGTKLIARKAKIMDDCFEDLNLRFGIITADLDDAILLQDDSEGYDTMDQEEEEAFFRSMEEAQNNERSSQQ